MAEAVSKPRSPYPVVALVTVLFVFIYNFPLFSPILLSFLLILLLTLALNPVVMALRRFFRRAVAALLMAVIFLGALGFLGWAFYTPLKVSLGKFFTHLPAYWQKLEAPLRHIPAPPTPVPPGQKQPANAAQGLHIDAQELMSALGHGVQAMLTNTAALALVIVTVFVGVLYMLLNPRPVFRAFFAMVPEKHHPIACRIGRRVAIFVPRWALALVTGMAMIGGLVFFAMWPVLGLQNAVLMGLLAFALEAIPYVGAILAGLPALLMALGMGNGKPLWVVIAYVAIQLTEHNVISPLIIAGPLRQHPVAVIFSVMLCLAAFGVLGVLLAVPLIETFQIAYDEIYRPRYLPRTSDADLDVMARQMLNGPQDPNAPLPPAPPADGNGNHHFFAPHRRKATHEG